ncbi:MAG: hypothetical protein ABJQ71_11515 [Roseibium sp.]
MPVFADVLKEYPFLPPDKFLIAVHIRLNPDTAPSEDEFREICERMQSNYMEVAKPELTRH